VTYENLYCALCNGLAESDVRTGACAGGSTWTPCDSVTCPANSECAQTVADCDFEDVDNPLCGWTNLVSNDQYSYDQVNECLSDQHSN
jgi:hypothetical protein